MLTGLIESTIYELEHLSHEEGWRAAWWVTALMKAQSGIVAKFIADECQS